MISELGSIAVWYVRSMQKKKKKERMCNLALIAQSVMHGACVRLNKSCSSLF